MEGNYLYNYVSPQIAGAVFVPGTALRRPPEALPNCWGVVGAYDEVARLNDQDGYGTKPYSVSTLAAMFDDAIRSFLLYTAVTRYTNQLRETFSDARDTARAKHRRFKPRQLEQLRRELLTTSLDLPVVARDSTLLWEPRWRRWDGIEVKAVPSPGVLDPPDEFDLIERFGEGDQKRSRSSSRRTRPTGMCFPRCPPLARVRPRLVSDTAHSLWLAPLSPSR